MRDPVLEVGNGVFEAAADHAGFLHQRFQAAANGLVVPSAVMLAVRACLGEIVPPRDVM